MPDPFLNPDDENDPLLKWGSSLMGGQQLSQPDIPAMSMPPAAPTVSAPAQAPQNDYGALEALANVGPPPKSDGTANNIAAALAMLADAAFDKGRALGPIMGAWASRKDPALESYQLRLEDAKKRAEIAHLMQGAHGDPESNALRKRALDLQESGQQIQRDTLTTRQNGVPGLKDAMASLGMDPAQLEGMSDAQVNALKGVIAAKMRQGDSNAAWTDRNATREQNKLDAEGRRPALAQETAAASTRGRLEATNGTPDEAVANFEAANPKLQVREPGTFTHIGNNPRTASGRQQQLMTVTRALDASEALRQIEREYSAIPFEERLGDKATALASEYDKLKTEHQGIMQKIAGQGSGSAGERDFIREGLPSIHDMRAQAKLQGVESMLHLNSQAMLTPYGIGIRGEGKSQPAAASGEPDLAHGGRLSVTGGRKVSDTPPIPKEPGDGAQGGDTVRIRRADGVTGTIPTSELEYWKGQGAQVIQ